jgi:hypothetical protein
MAACPKCTALNPGVGAGGVGVGAVGSGIVCYKCGARFTGGDCLRACVYLLDVGWGVGRVGG